MRGAITPLPQYASMSWYLVKQWIHLHGVVLSSGQGRLYLYFSQPYKYVRALISYGNCDMQGTDLWNEASTVILLI